MPAVVSVVSANAHTLPAHMSDVKPMTAVSKTILLFFIGENLLNGYFLLICLIFPILCVLPKNYSCAVKKPEPNIFEKV